MILSRGKYKEMERSIRELQEKLADCETDLSYIQYEQRKAHQWGERPENWGA